jgi:hypothetical protein
MVRKRIFLSHSTNDALFVDRLASDLERLSIGVWYDKWELRVGDSLLDKIAAGIEENDYLVVVLTPASVASDWVRLELKAALMRELSEKRVVVLPVLLADCVLPTFLRDKKYADFRADYEHGFQDLLFGAFPESGIGVLRSRDFRNAQYLIAGLTSTDDHGTNLLNQTQMSKLYQFSEELQTYFGGSERRLLFWSAIAFKVSNPSTPFVLHSTTPVFSFFSKATDVELAEWVLDGLQGPLFNSLIPFFSWARSVNGDESLAERVREYLLPRCLPSDDGPLGSTPMTGAAMYFALKAIAADRPDLFERFLPTIARDVDASPLVVRSTVALPSPPDDAFYMELQDAPTRCAIAAYHTLADLGRPSAVDFLRRLVSTTHFESEKQDALFERIDQPGFVSQLQNWLTAESDLGIRARLLVALANCGFVLGSAIVDTIQERTKDRSSVEHSATLLRLLGRTRERGTTEILETWACRGGDVDAEAAVYSLGRVLGRDCHHTIRKYLKDERRLVAAAAIETLAKYVGPAAWDDVAASEYHRCPDTNTAFHRAVYCVKPSDLSAIASAEFQRPDARVRLSAARCLARISSHDQVSCWLSNSEIDMTSKTAFDEVLFARPPFVPDWFSYFDNFEPSVAAFDVRFTNLDPERIPQAVYSDQVRTINAFMAKPADRTSRQASPPALQ